MAQLPADLVHALRSRAASATDYIDMVQLGFQQHRIFPPASVEEIELVRERMGLPTPEPLSDLYAGVGNGGFGPGYGLLGLVDGAKDDLGQSALDVYSNFLVPDPTDSSWQWRPEVLPICYWGCVVYSCVDCSTEDAVMVGFDEGRWVAGRRTLEQWLRAWLDRGLTQPTASG